MKHIVKVNNIQDAKDNRIRPLIAMDSNGSLFTRGLVPKGFVDLGLASGTLWSTKNIGATNGDTAESWYGNYYAWGEIETKSNYHFKTYKHVNGDPNKITKYCNNAEYGNEGFTDELIQLVPEDDVATQTDPAWRMPTKEDFDELIAGTTNSWVTDYNGISGLNGRVFTSKANGNTLFIPAAGACDGTHIYYVDWACHLWTSSLYLDNPYRAHYQYFDSSQISMANLTRDTGFCVRAIC